MSRINRSISWFAALMLCWAAPAAFAQEAKPADPAVERAGEEPGDNPLGLTEGQRSREMEPPLGKLWPFFEVDRYRRDRHGDVPGYENIDQYLDVDFLMPFFGYRSQQMRAHDGWPAGEYGFSYAFPLWWNRWRPDRTDALLFPLAWHSDWRTGSRTVVPPLLASYGTQGEDWDASFLWPIFAAEQTGDQWRARAAPLVWAGGNSDRAFAAVVPLMWYERTPHQTTLITPLGGHHSDARYEYTMVTPLFHRWAEKNADGEPFRGAWTVPPLVWRFWNDDTGNSSFTVLPLVHHRRRGDEGETVVFPVFWDFKRQGERHTHAWPIYGYDAWYDDAGNPTYEQHSVAWPFFKAWTDHENETWGWDAPFPIAGYRGSKQRAEAWVMPVAWYERTDQKWAFISPMLLTFGGGNERRSDLIQMPFYWHFRRGEETTAVAPFSHYRRTGDHVTWSSFFPVTYGAWNQEQWAFRLLWEGLALQGGEDEFRMRVLGGLFDLRMIQDEVMFELNPFFRYESKGDRYTYFSLFLGLYSYERDGDQTSHAMFWTR